MREREISTIQNCPQAMGKTALTFSPSAHTQPEGALKLSGLTLADCPALGIPGSLMPCSQGVGCEQPVVWCGWKFGSAQQQLPRACACMSGFWDSEKVSNLELFVHGQGEVRGFFIGYSSSC